MEAITYVLAHDHPLGIAMPDAVNIVENRRRRPIFFKNAGDEINLETVDVPSFTKSAHSGTIHALHLQGVLRSKAVEVTEARGRALTVAFNTLMVDGGMMQGINSVLKTRVLEPGLTVGTMGAPDFPNIPMSDGSVISPTKSVASQIEPGVTAPNIDPASQELSMASAVAAEALAPQKDPGMAAAATAPSTDWKYDLDLQSQKSRLAESTDKDFLAEVAKSGPSRQLQKIAQARLAELGKA